MKPNLLITGISGFVGSVAARHFHSLGYNIVGLVKDINTKTQWDIHEFCSIVRGDVLDKQVIQTTLSKYEIEYVLHLASQPIVRICNNDPYSAYMTNIVGTLNILESIRTLKNPIKKMIAISSDKAYGPHEKLPYREDSPLVAADSYCTSKACQDMILRSYANTYNLPVSVVRAGNLYGPDLNLSRLIPCSILKLLAGESPTLYSGVANYIREFIYVDDVVAAFEILFQKGITGEAYNVGGTEPQRIGDVISLIRDKINPKIPIKIIEKDFYEIPEQYLDSSKLRSLGWTPGIGLSEGLDKTIEWFKGRCNC